MKSERFVMTLMHALEMATSAIFEILANNADGECIYEKHFGNFFDQNIAQYVKPAKRLLLF